MLFLKIYVVFSLLTFVLVLMQGYLIMKDLKRKYPDAVNRYEKDNKRNILERICSYTKVFISCFVPIINIGIFYVALFDSSKAKEETLADLEPYKYK